MRREEPRDSGGLGKALLKGDVGAVRMVGTSTQTPVPSSLPSTASASKGQTWPAARGQGTQAVVALGHSGHGPRAGGWVAGPFSSGSFSL